MANTKHKSLDPKYISQIILNYGLQPFQSLLLIDHPQVDQHIPAQFDHSHIYHKDFSPLNHSDILRNAPYDLIWIGNILDQLTPQKTSQLLKQLPKLLGVHGKCLGVIKDSQTQLKDVPRWQTIFKQHDLHLRQGDILSNPDHKLLYIVTDQTYTGDPNGFPLQQLKGVIKPGSKTKQPLPSWKQALKIARSINDFLSMDEVQQQAVYRHSSQLKRNTIILELGVAYGKTGSVIALSSLHTGSHYVAVDTFGMCGTPKQFKKRFDQRGLPFQLWVSDSNTLNWDTPIDLLIIDAGHDTESAKNDIFKYVPLVKKDGIVMFHDYDSVLDMNSQHWAIKYYADQFTGTWETLDHIGGLMIRRKPKNPYAWLGHQ